MGSRLSGSPQRLVPRSGWGPAPPGALIVFLYPSRPDLVSLDLKLSKSFPAVNWFIRIHLSECDWRVSEWLGAQLWQMLPQNSLWVRLMWILSIPPPPSSLPLLEKAWREKLRTSAKPMRTRKKNRVPQGPGDYEEGQCVSVTCAGKWSSKTYFATGKVCDCEQVHIHACPLSLFLVLRLSSPTLRVFWPHRGQENISSLWSHSAWLSSNKALELGTVPLQGSGQWVAAQV